MTATLDRPDTTATHWVPTPVELRAKARTDAWVKAGMPPRPVSPSEQEYRDLLAAAQRDPQLWERVHASRIRPHEPTTCVECGADITDRTWQTVDLLVIPATGGCYTWFAVSPRRVMGMVVGNVKVCAECLESGAAARKRRKGRTKRRGQFLAEQA